MLMRLLALAGLTLRSAVRSRVFAVLIAAVLVCVLGLPLIIKSDGTAAGQAQLFLHYAFGLAGGLLSAAAAWSAAGAIALEVSGRQMHVLTTKPVRAIELWLGKLIGLMAINLVMAVLAVGLIYGLLRWTTRPAALPAAERDRLREDVLSAHSLIAPIEPAPVPPGPMPGQRVLLTVPPRAGQTWLFQAPPRPAALSLQVRFAASRLERQAPVLGDWRCTAEDGTVLLRTESSLTPHATHTLPLAAAAPGQRLLVAYRNAEEAAPATVLFDTATGARLWVREGSLEGNMARALLLTLARLTFFTALGLTAGALFSFPVAVFTAFAFLGFTGLSGWVETDWPALDPNAVPAWLAAAFQQAGVLFHRLTGWITPPLAPYDPLDFLPSGGAIPWRLVGRAWGLLAGLYGGALALAGAWLFSRRELGLSEKR